MGVVCMCTSMLCIFISTQWTWKGTGSGSKYWTEVHTDLGVISTVLAVAQPINSLFRWPLKDARHHKIVFFLDADPLILKESFSTGHTDVSELSPTLLLSLPSLLQQCNSRESGMSHSWSWCLSVCQLPSVWRSQLLSHFWRVIDSEQRLLLGWVVGF